jgi:hypothetical protein
MRLVALALAALSVACGGPSVGELISQEVSLTVRAVSSDPSAVALGEPDGGAALSRAFLSASALTLLPCSEDIELLVLEPRGYELLAEPPPSERISTAVNTFCGVRLDVEPLEENAAPGVPEGASLFVEGTDASGAPFSRSSSASLSVLLETDEAESFGKVPLLLGFDAVAWLPDLQLAEDMSDLPASALEEQLEAAVALYVDVDEDGVLDDDESRPILRAQSP